MSKNHRHEAKLGLRLAALGLFSAACSGGTINLGEVSNAVTASAHCQVGDGGRLLVENQDQLDQLTGCQEIDGDLHVRPFAGADFTPLAALRNVKGVLQLGRFSAQDTLIEPELASVDVSAAFDKELALMTGGWIRTLAGFENLEHAGSLVLWGVGAPTLAPFSKLGPLVGGSNSAVSPTVAATYGEYFSTFSIQHCQNLTDLTGLEGATGAANITVDCDSLESLRGFPFPTEIRNVSISGAQLADLGAFDVQEVDELVIQNTGLQRLDELASVTRAGSITVTDNAALINLDGLDAVGFLGTLSIEGNAALEALPEFKNLNSLQTLQIGYNDSLRSIPNFAHIEGPTAVGLNSVLDLNPLDQLQYHTDLINIENNPRLEHFTVPPAWQQAGIVQISGNDQLQSIDFSNLQSIDQLLIASNPALASVALGQLTRTDVLSVANAPLLPPNSFDGVQAFERDIASSDGTSYLPSDGATP